MNSNFFEKQNQKEQIEALLALLPRLKTELSFAGYQQKNKSGLFTRIDNQYQALKTLQEIPNASDDPFYCEIEKPVEALQAYKFYEEAYHVDDIEHCQVELIHHEQPYGLENILEEIERHQAWEDCFSMLNERPLSWLLSFSEQIKNTKDYHTQCQLKVFKQLRYNESMLLVLQSASSWHWSSNNKSLILTLLEAIEHLSTDEGGEKAFKEVNADILNRIKRELNILYANI